MYRQRNPLRVEISNIKYYIVPFSCILLQYNAPILTYGILVLLAICVLYAVKNAGVRVDKDLLNITCILTIQLIISELFFHFGVFSQIKKILYVWVVCLITSLGNCMEDKDKFYKGYRAMCYFTTTVVLIQMAYSLATRRIPDPIRILPVRLEDSQLWVVNATRPSGLFSEPSSYMVYMIPFIIIALFWRNSIVDAVFITLGVLISGSSSGIIVSFIIWAIAIMKSTLLKRYKWLLICGFALLAFVFQYSSLFAVGSAKIQDIFSSFNDYRYLNFTSQYSYSNYLRLIKGWVTVFESPLSVKLLGIGNGNLLNLIEQYQINYSWGIRWGVTSSSAGYYSSASGIFLEAGLIAGTMYYLFLFKKCRVDMVGKCIMLALIIIGFSGSTFYNSTALFYFMTYYFFVKPDRQVLIRFGY